MNPSADQGKILLSYLNFMPESLAERAEQWNSDAPEPSKILCRFLSVMPPPGGENALHHHKSDALVYYFQKEPDPQHHKIQDHSFVLDLKLIQKTHQTPILMDATDTTVQELHPLNLVHYIAITMSLAALINVRGGSLLQFCLPHLWVVTVLGKEHQHSLKGKEISPTSHLWNMIPIKRVKEEWRRNREIARSCSDKMLRTMSLAWLEAAMG